MTSPEMARPEKRRVWIDTFWLDALDEREVIGSVRDAWAAGRGGSIIPVNVDVARTVNRQPDLGRLLGEGSLFVGGGMAPLWGGAGAGGRSIFLLGGAEGVPEKAAQALTPRFPGPRVAGAISPPFG